jgi:hypothetical protein
MLKRQQRFVKIKNRIRAIKDIKISGINKRDHPDYVDSRIISATWVSTGIPLTDEEIEYINEHQPEIAQDLARNSIRED